VLMGLPAGYMSARFSKLLKEENQVFSQSPRCGTATTSGHMRLFIRLLLVAILTLYVDAKRTKCVAKKSCSQVEDPKCIAKTSCTEGCDLCLTPTSSDGCTSISFCEWNGEDCRQCSSQTDEDACTDLTFCEWMSECTAKTSCTWFQDSACVAKDTCNTECGLCTTITAQSVNVCAEMKECEWKDDCRQCKNLSHSDTWGLCVAEEFCEWKQGSALRYPFTAVDIVFVIFALVFELGTMYDLYTWVSVQVHSRSSMLV